MSGKSGKGSENELRDEREGRERFRSGEKHESGNGSKK